MPISDFPRCSTCRFWDDGTCDRVDAWRPACPTVFEIDVKVCDDSGLSTKLRTGPDFGCVLHENRPIDND